MKCKYCKRTLIPDPEDPGTFMLTKKDFRDDHTAYHGTCDKSPTKYGPHRPSESHTVEEIMKFYP